MEALKFSQSLISVSQQRMCKFASFVINKSEGACSNYFFGLLPNLASSSGFKPACTYRNSHTLVHSFTHKMRVSCCLLMDLGYTSGETADCSPLMFLSANQRVVRAPGDFLWCSGTAAELARVIVCCAIAISQNSLFLVCVQSLLCAIHLRRLRLSLCAPDKNTPFYGGEIQLAFWFITRLHWRR